MALDRFDGRYGDIGTSAGLAMGRPSLGGESCLMWATRKDRIDAVEMLREYMKKESGCTDLICAAAFGDVAGVRQYLDECGRRDTSDRTALMWAAANGHMEVVRVLAKCEGKRKDSEGMTALMRAAEKGHGEAVRVLVEHEKGMVSNKGRTSLMHAAMNGHTDIVQILVEHEGGMKDNAGMTARMLAISCGRSSIADLLAKYE